MAVKLLQSFIQVRPAIIETEVSVEQITSDMSVMVAAIVPVSKRMVLSTAEVYSPSGESEH